ncbi:uncharacterized protein LOC111112983 [Crassostrea virginica]
MATKEDRNVETVRRALDKPCNGLLQEVLRDYVPEKDLYKLLNDPAKKRKIIPFVRKLNQESTLYPQTGVFNGSYADFDVSLLYVLIRNLTGIPDHKTGWGKEPNITDNSTAANIERIRLLRNTYAHNGSASHLPDTEFEKVWKKIISCIHGIEKTLPGQSTKFEDGAKEILNAAKTQEDLGKNLTKCKDDIAYTLKIQKEQALRVECTRSELKETQGALHTVKGRINEHEELIKKNSDECQEAIALTLKKQKEQTSRVEKIHNELKDSKEAIALTLKKQKEQTSRVEKMHNELKDSKGNIAYTLKIQKEQALRYECMLSELKETRGELYSVKGGIEKHQNLFLRKTQENQEAIALTLKKQNEQTSRVEKIHNEMKESQGDIHSVKERIDEHETFIRSNQVEINAVRKRIDEHEKLMKRKTIGYKETDSEKSMFRHWLEDDAFFILTRAAKKVDKLIKTNNLVIVTGHSGSGKSAIIQHIALQYRSQGWIIKPVYSFQEIHDAYRSRNFEKGLYIFVFNDPIGKESYDEMSYNEWIRYREILDLLIKDAKLLLTCRRSIFFDPRAKGFFEQNLDEEEVSEQKLIKIDINDNNYKLSTDEKKTMFKKHMPAAKPTKHDLDQICEIDMYFPLLCKWCRCKQMQTKNILNVFKEPVKFLKTEIETYKDKNKELYCGLVCLILSKNELCLDDLEKKAALFSKSLKLCELPPSTLPSTIINKLEPLLGLFVRKIGEKFSFYHDFVMEVTTYVLCSQHPQETIEFADLSFLRKRISVGKNKSKPRFSILLNHKHIKDLVDRFFEELIGNRFIEVILSPSLKDEDVISGLKPKLKELADQGKLDLITEPQNTKTDKQQFQHLMTESLYTRLDFVSSEDQCSPLFALIAFCHDDLSEFCLNLLEERQSAFWKWAFAFVNPLKRRTMDVKKKCLFPAICANGKMNFLQRFTDNEIIQCKEIRWNNMYPIHIVSVFHNYHILDNVINDTTNVDIFTTGENPMTPLMLASENYTQEIRENEWELDSRESIQRNRVVEALLQKGANVNLCNSNGICPLYKACQNGHESTAQLLLNNGADVNLCNNYGICPLLIACRNGHKSTAQLLLRNGADANSCRKDGISPLWIACQSGHENIVELLLNNGADVNLCNNAGKSPLLKACQYGHENIVQLLLNYGADAHKCQRNGISPLWIACQNGHEGIVELLLRKGVEVNSCENSGISPLYKACRNGHKKTVQLLLSKGAKVNLCNSNKTSPLLKACQYGHESTAQLLLKNGANVNLCDQNGTTPLLIACRNGHDSIVQLLLNNAADVKLRNNNGNSPLDEAYRNNRASIAHLLQKKS